jgi:type II secretory pathway component PulF
MNSENLIVDFIIPRLKEKLWQPQCLKMAFFVSWFTCFFFFFFFFFLFFLKLKKKKKKKKKKKLCLLLDCKTDQG